MAVDARPLHRVRDGLIRLQDPLYTHYTVTGLPNGRVPSVTLRYGRSTGARQGSGCSNGPVTHDSLPGKHGSHNNLHTHTYCITRANRLKKVSSWGVHPFPGCPGSACRRRKLNGWKGGTWASLDGSGRARSARTIDVLDTCIALPHGGGPGSR